MKVVDSSEGPFDTDDRGDAFAEGRLDLAELLREVALRPAPPPGYLAGRTAIRDSVSEIIGCSLLEAEQIVAQLEARRWIVYPGPTQSAVDRGFDWRFVGPR